MIITDSLGAPRKISHTLKYEETWPSLLSNWYLQNKKYNHFVFTHQGLDTHQLVELTKQKLDLYDKNEIFLHIGIVDCSRRVLSLKAQRIINILPGIRWVIKRIAHKYHFELTRLYKVTYTKEKVFKENLEFFFNTFSSSVIYVLPILPVGDNFKRKSFGIDKQIDTYNKILFQLNVENENVVFFKELSELFIISHDSLYMNDGYHLNKNAHKAIYEYLIKNISV